MRCKPLLVKVLKRGSSILMFVALFTFMLHVLRLKTNLNHIFTCSSMHKHHYYMLKKLKDQRLTLVFCKNTKNELDFQCLVLLFCSPSFALACLTFFSLFFLMEMDKNEAKEKKTTRLILLLLARSSKAHTFINY